MAHTVQFERLPQHAIEDVAASAAAFAHGLVVQVLFDPERFPVAGFGLG